MLKRNQNMAIIYSVIWLLCLLARPAAHLTITACLVPRYAVRVVTPVIRYVYDWGAHRCVVWHWWTDPSRCSIPVDENNFASLKECINACSGWA
ncbi:hypothetical protein MSG28_010695 [Choristoneura fumiferana]|uniref:Uncharacterized protein n=1 Tax=Choristoneura fumiferana TaxID=7141 RepID=A0ACC0KNL3_CHOFU|nr:hypothetical protein MSG28_010695 [Choristoneura fumiferana]